MFPADAAARATVKLADTRLAAIAAALDDAGLEPVAVPYADAAADAVRAQLLAVDGALVWVNPIERERDRTVLNTLLKEVAAAGVFVSAHPRVIAKIGTKEVLYRTRAMGWGCDTRLYASAAALNAELPRCLASGQPRVLKQDRGNGGNGVWKVEAAAPVAAGTTALPPDALVRVRHAKRGSAEEDMPLGQFLDRCAAYFSAGGQMIDQAYQARLRDGMVRCYLVGDRVAGFGEQRINALYPAAPGADPASAPQPGPRLYYPPTRADFQPLKQTMERDWLPALCHIVGLDRAELPVIWDADFLYGPKDATGADSYVLCEINVSSVFPFPDDALAPLAAATRARLAARN